MRRIYRLLCCLAWCDGELHPKEREYLEAFAEHFGITADETAILEEEGKHSQDLGVSKRPSEKRLLADALIDIAMADGQLVAEEQKRLVNFGKTIGLSEDDLATRIMERVSETGRKIQSTRRFQAIDGDIYYET
jgi:tellurite resistance protein